MSTMDIADFRRRLAAVDWTGYEAGLYRKELQKNLVELVRDDAEAFRRRLQMIEDCLLPWGGLAEIALHALPFVLELVHHGVGDGMLYEIVVPIAACSEPPKDHETFTDGRAALGDRCLERLAAGIPDYLRDVGRRDWSIGYRGLVLGVLASLVRWRDQWLPPLRALYESEPDPKMKATIVSWFPDLPR